MKREKQYVPQTLVYPQVTSHNVATRLLLIFSIASLLAGLALAAQMGIPDKMWVLFLFTPVPLASIIYGGYRCSRGFRCVSNIVVGAIMLLLLCVYGSFAFVFGGASPLGTTQRAGDISVVQEYEELTGVALPEEGTVSATAYGDRSMRFGGTKLRQHVSVKMDHSAFHDFLGDIFMEELWLEKKQTPTVLSAALPITNSIEYDHMLLYNVTTGEYNALPDASGTYQYVLLGVSSSENMLTIMDYDKEWVAAP